MVDVEHECCVVCRVVVDLSNPNGEESICSNEYCSAALCVPCQKGMMRVFDFKCPNCREESVPNMRWEVKEIYRGIVEWVDERRNIADCPPWLVSAMEVFVDPAFYVLSGITREEMVDSNFPRGPLLRLPYEVYSYYVHRLAENGFSPIRDGLVHSSLVERDDGSMEEEIDREDITLVQLFVRFLKSPTCVSVWRQ